MRKIVLAVLAAMVAGAIAAYAGSSTVNYTSSGSAPFRTTTDGSSNNIANTTIWDSVAGVNGLTISATGAAKVDGSAVTQPISGAVNQGTAGASSWLVTGAGGVFPVTATALPLPAGAATAALQGTNTATTAHTCAVAGYSELGCLGQIDDDIKGPIATGTNTIGNINGAPNVTPTDCSLAVTLGGTAQNIIAASAAIHGFTIANIDPTTGSGEPVWISFTTSAVASAVGSYPLAAPAATTFAGMSSYTTPVGFGANHAVSVVAATTGHKISCTFW